MKIKTQLLREYLGKKKLSVEELADDMETSVAELEKLLNGEAVDVKAATLFIFYFGADEAQKFIDWEAIGKKNPLANEILKTDNDEFQS